MYSDGPAPMRRGCCLRCEGRAAHCQSRAAGCRQAGVHLQRRLIRRPPKRPVCQGANQGRLIDHRTARRVDQNRIRFHQSELIIRHQVVAGGVEVAVQADKVRLFQKLVLARPSECAFAPRNPPAWRPGRFRATACRMPMHALGDGFSRIADPDDPHGAFVQRPAGDFFPGSGFHLGDPE